MNALNPAPILLFVLFFCTSIASQAQESVTNMQHSVAYYEFDNTIKNRAVPDSKANTDLASPLRFKDNHLYSNGSYSDYYNNRTKEPYLWASMKESDGSMAISLTFKLEQPDELNKMQHIFKISGKKRDINLYKAKEGHFLVEYDNYEGEKEISLMHNITNAEIPYNTWCNVLLMHNRDKEELEFYLNGEALSPLSIKKSPWSMGSILSFSFANARRGIVMRGFVDKLTVFNSKLSKNDQNEVYKFMTESVGPLKKLVDPNKTVINGTDNPEKLLGIAGLTSFYHFNKNVGNQVKPDDFLFSVMSPFSYTSNSLYVNGSYSDYYKYNGDRVVKIPIQEGNGNFSFSINCKNEEPEDGYWGRTIVKMEFDKQVLILSRYKEGYLCLEFDVYVDQKIESRNFVFRNTNMKEGDWCNITLSFNQATKKAQVYLNGTALLEAVISGFDLSQSKSKFGICTFANRGNGSVFKGEIQKLAIFNRALTDKEVGTLVKNIGVGLAPFPNMITGPNEKRDKTDYNIEEHWTYLPGCVAGDKAKKVKVACQNGADLSYLISADKDEKTFFIIENAFSPALENSASSSFESCLAKLKRIVAIRCQ